MIELLPLFIGVFLAQISPGPNLMAVASIALGSGRRAGVATASGVATGVLVWAVLFTFGLAAIFDLYPQTIIAMKMLGGSYLLYLAAKAGYSAWHHSSVQFKPDEAVVSPVMAWKTGILVVLTNPKAALMWVAISTFLASQNQSAAYFLVVGACVSLSAMAIYSTYAFLFSTGVVSRSYGKVSRYVEIGFAATFGLLGGKLLFDSIRELRT